MKLFISMLLFTCSFFTVQSQPYFIVVSGPTEICGANTTSLTVSPLTGTQYRWFAYPVYPFGMPIFVGPVYISPISGIFICEVTNASGTSVTVNQVTIRNPADAYVPNPAQAHVCQGTPVMLSEQISNIYMMNFYNSYQWKKNGVNIAGAISWNYMATQTGSYTVTVSNNCGSATSNSQSITVDATLPAPGISVSGPTTFCQGGSVLLSVPVDPTYSYLWIKDGFPIAGASSSTYLANQSGNFSCTISNLCGTSPMGLVTVTVVPAAVAEISVSGSTSISACSSVTLSIAPCGSCSVQWKKSGAVIPGATSSTYQATSAGSYTASVTSGSCVTESAVPVVVNVSAVIGTGGPTTFCSGGSVFLGYPLNVGCSFQWKNSGSNIPGATSSSYIAISSGSYSVAITVADGSFVESNSIVVTVNPVPAVSFSGLASSYLCVDPPAVLTGSPAGGFFSGTGISGNIFNPGAAGIGGPYSITYSYINGFGCSASASQSTSVTGGYNCAVPQNVTVTNIATTSAKINWQFSSASQFQVRYKKVSGGPYTTKSFSWTPCITNYTLSGLKKNTAYLLSIRALCASGNSAYSTEVTFTTLPARFGQESEFAITTFPNPVSDMLHLEIQSGSDESVQVNLVDVSGRAVLLKEFRIGTGANEISINVSELNPGFYVAVIRSLTQSRMIPFIKK